MKKHAYLIEAHNNYSQLETLLKCLDYEENDIYVHIDAKSVGFESLKINNPLKYSTLNIIDSISVHWGGFSQIIVELNLLTATLNQSEYCRFHLISGADLPLKTQKEIHAFFDSHAETEFIHFDYDNSPDIYKKRLAQYHYLRDRIDRSDKLWCFVEKVSVALQKMVGVNRLRNIDVELAKGSNWFSITEKCAKYVLDHKDWILRNFKYTKCCDEVFLQTLIYNSEFRNHLYYDEFEKRHGNMRYTDWKRENPYVFRKDDFDQLISSHYMFARKFDEKIDKDIILKIRTYLSNEELRG